jgi:hypothetical protein
MERPINKIRIPGHKGPHGFYNGIVLQRLSDAVAGYAPGSAAYRSALAGQLVDLRRSLRSYDGLRALVTASAGSMERKFMRGVLG